MGMAMALPRHAPADDVARCLSWLRDGYGLPSPIRLFNSQRLDVKAELDISDESPLNLRPKTWIGPARNWATVTPVVFDRHFEGSGKWDKAAEMVKNACERAGLPRPAEALLHPVSLFEGVPISRDFPQLTRKNSGGRMYHSHAVIVFREEVEGPVSIGAGRFRGYGFCRPAQGGVNG
jgi:CRISPR-associated protein Csb2